MKKRKIVCLFLALTMLLAVFASCASGAGGAEDGGGRTGEGWEGVDFKGQKVKLCVSVNQYSECTFPAASLYTKGPDQADSNEVTKEVLARNARAEQDLNLEIEYMERDLTYLDVLPDIRDIVLSASANSPDIYNNDLYGLSRAMVNGFLWNVKNPGTDASGKAYTNYFDFSREGWYEDFIKGCTFDQNKYYIFAGDYFIDMIRLAWVVLVNNGVFTENVGKFPNWCSSIDEFYDYVREGYWDFDMIAKLSAAVHIDGGQLGKTERTDTLVGFAINHTTDWVFESSAGVGTYYLDENYEPHVMDGIDTYQKAVNAYMDMYNSMGVYYEQAVLTSTECFMQGNFLFAVSRLGEMESPALRDIDIDKGIVPTPKWSQDYQDEYHTVAHDQTEVGCVLKSAQAYSAASALMQYLNEESGSVVYAYYDKGLKYKYNDDANSRDMMDIIRESLDTPFSFQIGPLCHQMLYTGVGTPATFTLESTSLSANFNSWKGAYNDCLKKMKEKFASFD